MLKAENIPLVSNGVTKSRRTSEFQMPLLPDPGKGELPGVEPLDFSVRLGNTLARGLDADSRRVEKELTRMCRRQSSSMNLALPERKVSGVSPRSPSDTENGFHANARNSHARKVSRRLSNKRTSAASDIFTSNKETV